MESMALARQRGRAAQLRSLSSEAHVQAEQQRAAQRRQANKRISRHLAALKLLQLEKELESRRCQLCDLVRAQAWGLGQSNWMERQCARCWAARAEQRSLERHFGDPAASELQPPAPLQDKVQELEQIAAAAAELASSAASHSINPDGRSMRHAAAAAAGVRGAAAPQPAAAASDGNRGHAGHEISSWFGQPQASQQQQHGEGPSVQTSEDPAQHGTKEELVAAVRARDASKLMELLDPGSLEQLLQLAGIDLEGRAHASSSAAGSHGASGVQTSRSLAPAGASSSHDSRRAWAAQAAKQAAAEKRQKGAAAASAAGHDRHGGLQQRQNPPQSADAAGATASRAAVEPDNANDSIQRLEAELREAEQQLVFGSTQAARSAALFLASQLREELAVLRRLQRKQQKAAQQQMYSARLHTVDHMGIKHVVRPGSGLHQPGARESVARTADSTAGCQPSSAAATVAGGNHMPGPAAEQRLQRPTSGPSVAAVAAAAPSGGAAGGQRHHQRHRRHSQSDAFIVRPQPNHPPVVLHAQRLVEGWPEKRAPAETHPNATDPSRQMDEVPWRPCRSKAKPMEHPQGWCSVGDYQELDPMREFQRLRSMRVDDYKSQLRKMREWRAAVQELQLQAQPQPQGQAQ